MDISIVIPNYNCEKLLKENLPKVFSAIHGYKNGKVEIVVCDDASSDNSIHVVEDFFTSIKDSYVKGVLVKSASRKDGGFSKNVNRGVKDAKGDIIILLNTDVVPEKGFLEALLEHFSDEKVFAVGCMDKSIEDGKIVLRGRGVGRWERGFLLHRAGSLDKNTTLWVSGGSGAFRKSLWDKLGGLNEILNPFYWEDIDLSYRAQKAGYSVLFEKKSIVVHEHSKGSIQANFKPYHVQKTVYRNQFLFVWLNITDISLLVNHIFWLPIHISNATKSGNKAFLAGLSAALTRLPKVVAYKKKMKKLFTLSDKEILERFSKEK